MSWAVLIAIAIPVFSNQLENAMDATTLANLLSAYAEASAEFLTDSLALGEFVEKTFHVESTDTNYGDTTKLPFTVSGMVAGPTDATASFTFENTGITCVVSAGGSGGASS